MKATSLRPKHIGRIAEIIDENGANWGAHVILKCKTKRCGHNPELTIYTGGGNGFHILKSDTVILLKKKG